MSECHHNNGGLCIECECGVNSCCGIDHRCNKCRTYICDRCFADFNELCPVCTKEIVTDKQLLEHVMAKYNLTRDALITEFRKVEPVYRPKTVILKNIRRFHRYDYWNKFSIELLGMLHYDDYYLTEDKNAIIGDVLIGGKKFIIVHGFVSPDIPMGIMCEDADHVTFKDVYWIGSLCEKNGKYGNRYKFSDICEKWYNAATLKGTHYEDVWYPSDEDEEDD